MDLVEVWDRFLNTVRAFFRERGYAEVITPSLLRHPNLDPNVAPLEVPLRIRGRAERRWLHTSPEYSMKKVLARFKRDLFQITKVFRDGELGRHHRPEFLMLEWYKVGGDADYLIGEIGELLNRLMGEIEIHQTTVESAFERFLGVRIADDERGMKEEMKKAGIPFEENEDWETLFERCFLELQRRAEDLPALFLKDFPERLSFLAKIKDGNAERFELLMRGVEIASGWTEETDKEEVRRRLEKEAKKRCLPLDEQFIESHREMPECAGCSIGLDRLMMIWLGKDELKDIELLSDELL